MVRHARRFRARSAFTLIELLVVVAIVAILASLLLPALGRAKHLGRLAKCASNERQMSLGVQLYANETGFFPGHTVSVGHGLSPQHTQYYWFQAIEPFVGQRWKESLYDCPGFPFKPKYRMSERFGPTPFGEYDYNRSGTVSTDIGAYGLGLKHLLESDGQWLPESMVVAPSDMAQLGDAYCEEGNNSLIALTIQWGYQIVEDEGQRIRARVSARQRHSGRYNIAYCDGHVESMKPSKFFGQDDRAMSRVNRDRLPHRDMAKMWPSIKD
jgi:prepilin-type N-terminal cleavage/methylation domain-containing protein/prepilin-type processing-associated H-X9-DG protein